MNQYRSFKVGRSHALPAALKPSTQVDQIARSPRPNAFNWSMTLLRSRIAFFGSGARFSLRNPRHIHPRALFPALDPFFRQLYALHRFEQPPPERLIFHHVAQKKFPLNLERIIEWLLLRHLLPALEIIDRTRNIRIPHRPRS